ncbi:hypothetical protein G6F22_013425 [Rhizopus arrhizus]|nr:hypothetical protein G6F22_013425 [Rhizopus arrhizus]
MPGVTRITSSIPCRPKSSISARVITLMVCGVCRAAAFGDGTQLVGDDLHGLQGLRGGRLRGLVAVIGGLRGGDATAGQCGDQQALRERLRQQAATRQ